MKITIRTIIDMIEEGVIIKVFSTETDGEPEYFDSLLDVHNEKVGSLERAVKDSIK